MTGRIMKSIFATALIAVVLTAAMILWALYGNMESTTVAGLKTEANYLSFALAKEEDDAAYFDGFQAENRVTLIAPNGTVLYDSKEEAASMENHSGREEVQEALEKGVGESKRYSSTLDENTLYYAKRLDDGNILRVSGSQRSVLGLLLGLITVFIEIVVAVLIISLVGARLMSKRIVAPINEIDLERPLENDAYAELSPLMLRMEKQRREIRDKMEQLKEQRGEFAAVTENMSEGLMVLDGSAAVLSLNESAVKIFGASPKEAVGGNVLALDRSEELQETVSAALGGEAASACMSKNGRYYELLANPVRKEDEVMGAILLAMDITEKAMAERNRREFTANVSHELKTPLTSISGYAEIMKNGVAREDDMKEFASRIYDEANRLIRLVNDTIKLSQLDEKAALPEMETVDLMTVAKDVEASLGEQAAKLGITLEVNGENCMVKGIHRLVSDMIYNFCENAVKYNKAGGSVSVTVSGGDMPSVTIADTGIGIPKEEQERVFERFYRVDKSHSKETGGTGLGLSIAKHAADVTGAEISMESEPGRGTTVMITFQKA